MSTSRSPIPFPAAESSVLPDPSRFFSPHLLSDPLPTNSFFQNFTLGKGDKPEYFHPYLIKPSLSSLSISYPSPLSHSSAFIRADFDPEITFTRSDGPREAHKITSFSDLGVTLEYPSSNLKIFLVRGSPYVTFDVKCSSAFKIDTKSLSSMSMVHTDSSRTKYTLRFTENNHTWLIYVPSKIVLTRDGKSSILCKCMVSGQIRVAVLPPCSSGVFEQTLDKYSLSYPVAGHGEFRESSVLEYKWDIKGDGDLLMLSHPLHRKLLSKNDRSVTLLQNFKYDSIDGELVGVVGNSWVLKADPVGVTWHSPARIQEDSRQEILCSLKKDVEALGSSLGVVKSSSLYSCGKSMARAARLMLIAEEFGYLSEVTPAISAYLKKKIEPWLDGSFKDNGFLIDPKWGGFITKQGSTDSSADCGFGMYDNHHYQLGYFVYAIAVLAKIDHSWGNKYKAHAYSLVGDYMTKKKGANLRDFDLYTLHSWAGGLMESPHGRSQMITSEAINAYYSAALLGLAYRDTHLSTTASTLMSLEIDATKMWWQVKENSVTYPPSFTAHNRLVGELSSTKRHRPFSKEWHVGMHLLPILPVSRSLFPDLQFVDQLLKWTTPGGEAAKDFQGFDCALQTLVDKPEALERTSALTVFDEGNSLTNLLWWIHGPADSL